MYLFIHKVVIAKLIVSQAWIIMIANVDAARFMEFFGINLLNVSIEIHEKSINCGLIYLNCCDFNFSI